MARKPRDAELVAWRNLRVEALGTHSPVLLDSLKVQLEALSAHSAIDQDACRKLRALIDDIERDIDRARTIGDRAPG